ncbi:hypothetical protein [Mucilaginibacter sp.]
MINDQKISELPLASAIGNSDACLLVSNGTDYQFAMSLLLQYVGNNLNTGANLSFGANLPPNATGKNGDVFVNISTGAMAQKNAGTWIINYTPAASAAISSANVVLYGLGMPLPAAGSDGDTYINTGTGIFYKKNSGNWYQVFSMQSGPAGPPGIKGDTGAAGNNGNTLLNGITDPDNQQSGRDGDFYINTLTYTLFGPKTNGGWSAGIELIHPPSPPVLIDFPVGTLTPINISNYQSAYANYGDHPTLILQEIVGTNQVRERTDIQLLRQFINQKLISISIDIPGDENAKTTSHLQLIIKP